MQVPNGMRPDDPNMFAEACLFENIKLSRLRSLLESNVWATGSLKKFPSDLIVIYMYMYVSLNLNFHNIV